MSKEVSDLSVLETSACLKNRTVALCVAGGIAAITAPLVARELRRFGARVQCLATPQALTFVGEAALEWASAQRVETEFRGLAPHICTYDALVVLPATANTLVKAQLGLCDDLVSTLIQSAFGQGKTVVFFPSMHLSLGHAPPVQEAIKKLEFMDNVHLCWGPLEEGKSKTLDAKSVAQVASYYVNKRLLPRRMDILLTTGGTAVPWDDVRVFTNRSTGHLGFLTALEAHRLGHPTVVLQGTTSYPLSPLPGLTVRPCPLFEDMTRVFEEEMAKRPHALLHLAALSDYTIENPVRGKYPSQSLPPGITWAKAPKLIDHPLANSVAYKLACKLTHETGDAGVHIAKDFLRTKKLSAVLWNSIQGAFESKTHEAALVAPSGVSTHLGKEEIARQIMTQVEGSLG